MLHEDNQDPRPPHPPLAIAHLPTAAISHPRKSFYLSVRTKFILTFSVSIAWAVFSTMIAQSWVTALSMDLGIVLAWLVVLSIAIIPGFMNAFLLSSLAMDNRPPRTSRLHYPGLSILVAAYNDQRTIVDTLESIARQSYPGDLDVLVVNDGSSDNTAALVQELLPNYPWLRLVDLKTHVGKANALNRALPQVRHSLVATVDADSYLFGDALTNIVERYVQDPSNTRAVAGAVLVRNSRATWITRAQEWEYFHGIACVKRMQSMYHGTMVAQGAFSVYHTKTLVELGGWPDCVGEDIVLSWSFLKNGYRIGYCEDALVFTNVPTTLSQLSKQRQRWSRGMIEAFKRHPGILLKRRLSIVFVYWNLFFPLLDLIFTLAFLPGIVLALFGYFWIVGPITLVLIPMGMMMNYFMYRIGCRLFAQNGLKVRFNISGFFIYSLLFSIIMQPIALTGYFAELLNLRKTWGTK